MLADVLDHALDQLAAGITRDERTDGRLGCARRSTRASPSMLRRARATWSAHRAAAGAIVGFAGVVRDHDGGRTVTRLEYSAHPTAQQTLAEVAAEIAAE